MSYSTPWGSSTSSSAATKELEKQAGKLMNSFKKGDLVAAFGGGMLAVGGGLVMAKVPETAIREQQLYNEKRGKPAVNFTAGHAGYIGGFADGMYALVQQHLHWFPAALTVAIMIVLLLDTANPQWFDLTNRFKWTYFIVSASYWAIFVVMYWVIPERSAAGGSVILNLTVATFVELGAVVGHDVDNSHASYLNMHLIAVAFFVAAGMVCVHDVMVRYSLKASGFDSTPPPSQG